MRPEQYCEGNVLVPGTVHYYALHPVSRDKRGAACALFAFEREIRKLIYAHQEPALARTKLEWWFSELDRLMHSRPRHPITRALLLYRGSYELNYEALYDLLDGVTRDLDTRGYPSFQSLKMYCTKIDGTVHKLTGTVFQHPQKPGAEFTQNLGVASALTRFISNLGYDVRHQRIYIPTDELDQFGVTRADLEQALISDRLRACIDYQCLRAHRYYDAALSGLPPAQYKAQRPTLILTAIWRATLAEISRSKVQLLRETVRLTPLRMRWIALRTPYSIRPKKTCRDH